MQQRQKSARHQRAASARWHAAEARAEAERAAGVPDRTEPADCRQPITLDLTSYGGPRLRIEPRLGHLAARAIDERTGEVVHCAAIKSLLHRIADDLPRMLAPRHRA